jgi:hypothetical protein
MHQGWTKFAQHLWYTTSAHGLAALTYAPNHLTAKVGKDSTAVTINEVTSYPFEDQVRFELTMPKAAAFPFQLRIPSWCKEATLLLNGQPLQHAKGGEIATVNRTWKSGDQLTLQLPVEVTTTVWGRNSRSVERGPLVYALKLNEKWEKGTDAEEGDYLSVYPKEVWNFALQRAAVEKPSEQLQFSVVKPAGDDFVWNLEHAPLQITAPAKRLPGWEAVNGVAYQPVTDRNGFYKGKTDSAIQKITLVPYGCTKVRIVAFPVAE